MQDNQQTNLDPKAGEKLMALGYNDISKRILNHSDFVEDSCKFTYWSSSAIRSAVSYFEPSEKINYAKYDAKLPLIEKEYAIEMVTVDDFLKIIDEGIVEIKLKFTDPKQSLVIYHETQSDRSIYAWDNNWMISHLTSDYEADGPEMWQCDISKYKLNTRLWYPVNIVSNAPWHNPTTGENSVVHVNYVCLGLDQAVAASNIGMDITPCLDDIINVATSPEPLLNDDLKPFVNEYNQQMLGSEYRFNPKDKCGWLFVAIKGYVFTRMVTLRTVNQHGQVRYFSFTA